MTLLNSKQTTTFFITTGVTLFLLISAGDVGLPKAYRVANPEMWLYALVESFGTSFICQIAYIILGIVDLVKKKRRTLGWIACSITSVLAIFLVKYSFPAPKSIFD
ncbi:hypothetical protein DB345_01830 [Spartobacteria bacterium LR76]|nr:hypothetical protein DB345_01830 [Spartobacteria bacterium LR76]